VQTRRDQVQAQAYLNARMISALLTAEPDAVEPPTRRTSVGLVWGVAVMLLLVGGFAVWGFIRPGGLGKLTTPGALVIDEVGTRYVFDGAVLHPVLNDASARLLLGAKFHAVRMNRKTLTGVPRGRPVGIPGAPDPLPEPARLSDAPWRVCATSAATGAGTEEPIAALFVAYSRTRTDAERIVGTDEAVLVRGPDDGSYLIWKGRRLRVNDPRVLRALSFDTRPPLTVTAGWLNALPAGADLTVPAVADRGAAGPVLDGHPTRIGQIFVVSNTGTAPRRFVLTRDGLLPVSAFDAALLMVDSGPAYPDAQPVELPLSAAAQAVARMAPVPPPAPDRPSEPPRPATPTAPATACVRVDVGADYVDVRLALTPNTPLGPPAVSGPGIVADRRTARQVAAPPGVGVLARSVVGAGVAGTAYYLVTDLGVKYPVPTAADVAALGYTSAPVPLPPQLLDLLPTGPSLNVQDARR
jgi:type VII secretion protein EccB